MNKPKTFNKIKIELSTLKKYIEIDTDYMLIYELSPYDNDDGSILGQSIMLYRILDSPNINVELFNYSPFSITHLTLSNIHDIYKNLDEKSFEFFASKNESIYSGYKFRIICYKHVNIFDSMLKK